MSDEQTATNETQTETTDTSATTEATSETVATETPAEDTGGTESDASTVLGAATTETGTGDADSEAATADQGDGAEVPEAYDLKLTQEDGSEVEIDKALLESATPVLKDLKLTNEQANKVAALVPKIQERLIEQQNDAFAETRTQWAKTAEADAEIGGKNWKASQSLAAKALDHFAGPATDANGNKNGFRQLLDESGLGNHPEMIRFCRKVGEGLAEDGTLARGSEGPREKPDRLKARYPTEHKQEG